MKFGKVQTRKFGTSTGAYSIVTERESYDSQITLTDYESEIIISQFGQSRINVGNVQSDKGLSSKEFRLYPNGKTIKLNVVYPKPEKTELRLYISSRAGFKPGGGEIWFLFVQNGEIWIGSMPESVWRSETSELKRDEYDEFYQNSINDPEAIRTSKQKAREIFSRDRKIALQRMEMSGFTCEFDSGHNLFISRFSRFPYLEAHHLIPMALQNDFTQPLDSVHNVFCLCPNCHRAVHHAEEPFARNILGKLASQRPILDEFELSVTDLFGLYSVEGID